MSKMLSKVCYMGPETTWAQSPNRLKCGPANRNSIQMLASLSSIIVKSHHHSHLANSGSINTNAFLKLSFFKKLPSHNDSNSLLFSSLSICFIPFLELHYMKLESTIINDAHTYQLLNQNNC